MIHTSPKPPARYAAGPIQSHISHPPFPPFPLPLPNLHPTVPRLNNSTRPIHHLQLHPDPRSSSSYVPAPPPLVQRPLLPPRHRPSVPLHCSHRHVLHLGEGSTCRSRRSAGSVSCRTGLRGRCSGTVFLLDGSGLRRDHRSLVARRLRRKGRIGLVGRMLALTACHCPSRIVGG
jgi:hypothetical protein